MQSAVLPFSLDYAEASARARAAIRLWTERWTKGGNIYICYDEYNIIMVYGMLWYS